MQPFAQSESQVTRKSAVRTFSCRACQAPRIWSWTVWPGAAAPVRPTKHAVRIARMNPPVLPSKLSPGVPGAVDRDLDFQLTKPGEVYDEHHTARL